MGYGDFENLDINSMTGLQWFYFLIFTLLIPLVFFNLLIAIISDTFDRVYSNKTSSDYREKASLILEVEYMIFWRRAGTQMQYLYSILRADSGDMQGSDWDGKINILRKDIQQVKGTVDGLRKKVGGFEAGLGRVETQ